MGNLPKLSIGVFTGINDGILHIDLSPFNLKVHKVGSDSIDTFLNSIVPTHQKSFLEFNRGLFQRIQIESGYMNVYIVVPEVISTPVTEKYFAMIQNAILIAYPSNFKLYSIVEYYSSGKEHGKYDEILTIPHGGVFKHSISKKDALIQKNDYELLNKFLEIAFRKTNFEWTRLSIRSYVSSFHHWSKEMAFISACISLESLIEGDQEISHRISRFCAIINSSDKKEGEIIYANVKKIYNHRSQLVHGSRFHASNYYLEYVHTLVSRTLVQLLLYTFESKIQLSKFMDSHGYGDFFAISNKIQWNRRLNSKLQEIIGTPLGKPEADQ